MSGRRHQIVQLWPEGGVCPNDTVQGSVIEISGGRYNCTAGYRSDRLLRRDGVLLQLVRIEGDDNCALVTTTWRRRRDAGKRGKERAHLIKSDVLQFALGVAVAGKQKEANGNTSGIEAGDE